MVIRQRRRRILVFVVVYLLLAVVPYLVLNWDIVVRVLADAVPPSPTAVVAILVVAGLIFGVLVYGADGVDRYAQFLLAPTDWLSILVALSFIMAASTWWAVPEAALSYYGRVDLSILYFLVFLGHVPMMLFLSLMAALGFAQDAAANR
jgi:hypothetical protein